MSSNDLVRPSGAARPRPAPPSRAGSVSSGSADSVLDGRGREAARGRPRAGRARRGRCRGAGGMAPDLSTIRSTASGAIRRSSGTNIEPRVHRAEVRGRQRGRRRATTSAPGRPARARAREPPRRDPAPPPHLAVRSSATSIPSSRRSPSACFGPDTGRRRPRAGRRGSPWSADPSGVPIVGRGGGACAGGWTAVCPRPRLPTRWSPSSGSPGRSSSGPTTSSPSWPWSSGSPSTGPTSAGGAGSMPGSPRCRSASCSAASSARAWSRAGRASTTWAGRSTPGRRCRTR